MTTETTPGATLLKWMKARGVSHAALGKAVGKSAGAVYGWTSDEFRPEALVRVKIDRLTSGEVPEPLWLTDGERAEIAHVQPFDSTVAA